MSSVHHWRLVAEVEAFTGDGPGDINQHQAERIATLIKTFLEALFPLGVRDLDLYDMTELAENAGMPFK